MINRFNFDPEPEPDKPDKPDKPDGSDYVFDCFADDLDKLIQVYSEKLTIGEIISTLTVTQHAMLTQSLEWLQKNKDKDDENDDE